MLNGGMLAQLLLAHVYWASRGGPLGRAPGAPAKRRGTAEQARTPRGGRCHPCPLPWRMPTGRQRRVHFAYARSGLQGRRQHWAQHCVLFGQGGKPQSRQNFGLPSVRFTHGVRALGRPHFWSSP